MELSTSLTQVNLAKVLQINQGAVSKMEKRADMYVSTLRNFIQAMGGQLQVKAIFPEGEVQIDQFESVDESHENPLAPARSAYTTQRQEQKQIPFGNDKQRNDKQRNDK